MKQYLLEIHLTTNEIQFIIKDNEVCIDKRKYSNRIQFDCHEIYFGNDCNERNSYLFDSFVENILTGNQIEHQFNYQIDYQLNDYKLSDEMIFVLFLYLLLLPLKQQYYFSKCLIFVTFPKCIKISIEQFDDLLNLSGINYENEIYFNNEIQYFDENENQNVNSIEMKMKRK